MATASPSTIFRDTETDLWRDVLRPSDGGFFPDVCAVLAREDCKTKSPCAKWPVIALSLPTDDDGDKDYCATVRQWVQALVRQHGSRLVRVWATVGELVFKNNIIT